MKTGSEIRNLEGEVFTQQDGEAVTLGNICVQALSVPSQDETPKDKGAKFKLAVDLHGKSDVDLESEDIVLIKECLAKLGISNILYGRAVELLEGKSNGKVKEK